MPPKAECKANCCAGRFIDTKGCMCKDGKCLNPHHGKPVDREFGKR